MKLSKLSYNYYDYGFSPSDEVKSLADSLATAASDSNLFTGVVHSDLALDFALCITKLLYKYKEANSERGND